MRLKLVFGTLFGVLLSALMHASPAHAAVCTQQTLWTTGATMTAATLNADPLYLYGTCLQNLDHTNIGAAGIYPSQNIPTNSTNATVGGSIAWIYPNGISLGTPLSQASGGTGIGHALDATLAPTGAVTGPSVVCWGDSIAFGYGSTSGNDFCTKVAAYYGLTAVNLGIGATMLENMNGAFAGANCGGIDRWNVEPPATYTVYPCTSAVAPATTHSLLWYAQNQPNDLFILEYATNDSLNAGYYTLSLPNYAANYATVVNGITSASATVNPDHIIILGESYQNISPTCSSCITTFPEASADKFTAAAAATALHFHTRYADLKRAMIEAATTSADFTPASPSPCSSTGLLFDFAHPCNAGYSAIANAIENATYVQAPVEQNTANGFAALATPCNVVLSAAYMDLCSAQIIPAPKAFTGPVGFSGPLSFTGGLVGTGGASISGASAFSSALTASGGEIVTGGVNVTGGAAFNSGLVVTAGGENITGTTLISGDTTVNGNLSTSGTFGAIGVISGNNGLIINAGGANISGASVVNAPLEAESVAAGTATYVPPIYTSGGAAVASTEHGVQYSCTFAAATTCAVSLSGANRGQFTSSTSYACDSPDMGTATTYVGYTVGGKSATGFTVYASASNSNTVNGTCWGT